MGAVGKSSRFSSLASGVAYCLLKGISRLALTSLAFGVGLGAFQWWRETCAIQAHTTFVPEGRIVGGLAALGLCTADAYWQTRTYGRPKPIGMTRLIVSLVLLIAFIIIAALLWSAML